MTDTTEIIQDLVSDFALRTRDKTSKQNRENKEKREIHIPNEVPNSLFQLLILKVSIIQIQCTDKMSSNFKYLLFAMILN